MADAEEIAHLQQVLALCCRRLHDLLVRGTLIGWPDVPIHIIVDLAATRAQIEHTQARLRQHGVVVADCTRELVILRPLGLMVTEPILKEAEELWTSNRYAEAVRVLRSAYATQHHDDTFAQRYLHYWYLLGLRAAILGELPVAYHAMQEVVHLDPGYKHAPELLGDLERQLREEPPTSAPGIVLPAPMPLRGESHTRVPHTGRPWVFSRVSPHGHILIGGIAVLIAVLLLINRGGWWRAPIVPGPVPTPPVITATPVIAVAPRPTSTIRAQEDSPSIHTTLPTARSTAAPAATLPPTPTARPAERPTALPPAPPAECGTARVGAPALHLRDAPLGASLRLLYQGTQLTLTCETQTVEARQWVKIRVTADPAIEGWVRADYLEHP